MKQMLQQQLEEQARMRREQRSAQTSPSLHGAGAAHALDPADIPEGWAAVGKIIFNPKLVLGHGCEGTIVYKYVWVQG